MKYHLEVRPGEGGIDAQAFAHELLKALIMRAKRSGSAAAVPGDSRTLIWTLDEKAAEAIESFTGVHRIQRIPNTDKMGRRHTSSVQVTLTSDAPLGELRISAEDLSVDYFRGSGPGGQHRNKTSSAVRLRHHPTGIIITRTSGRSQRSNLEDAKRELKEKLSTQALEDMRTDVNSQRVSQASTEDAKGFTHNQQRNETLDHSTGRRWRLSDFMKGKI